MPSVTLLILSEEQDMSKRQWRRYRVKVGVCEIGKGNNKKTYGKLTPNGDVFETNKDMVRIFGSAKFEDLGPAKYVPEEEDEEEIQEEVDPNWISVGELEAMTVSELHEECKSRGINVKRGALKRDLVSAIIQKQSAPTESIDETGGNDDEGNDNLSEEEKALLEEDNE